MGSVPEPYLDAWARLQVQRPETISDAEWQLAINDAGLFLDQWASLALEFVWTAGDLFDVPRHGKLGGLVWFLNGESVRSLGPEHAVMDSGLVSLRLRSQCAPILAKLAPNWRIGQRREMAQTRPACGCGALTAAVTSRTPRHLTRR
jgi:hypothetical protein